MNVIIIAAIALLVLVILAIIFIGRMTTTTKAIDKCPGNCITPTGDSPDSDCKEMFGTYYKATRDACLDSANKPIEGQVCCVGV